MLFVFLQLKLAQQREEEKKQLLEKRAEYKKKTEGLLKFSAAEMAAKERAAARARKVLLKIQFMVVDAVQKIKFFVYLQYFLLIEVLF